MKNNINVFLFLFVILITSCSKKFTDPSGPSVQQAFNSPQSLTAVAVGLQNWYTAGRGGNVYNYISTSGLLANELFVVNAGNTDEQQFYAGGNFVLNTNGIATSMWSVSNKIIADANNIMNNLSVVKDPGYASGLLAYASIFKALAMGNLATFWNNIPDTIGSKVNFISSNDGFNKALGVINNAINVINTTSPNTSFLNNIPAGIDLLNTLYALKARYSLFVGNYSDALSAANLVNLSTKSVFNYNTITLNPIFSIAASTNNVYQPTDSNLGLPAGIQPDPSDARLPFYLSTNAIAPIYRIKGFFNTSTGSIPVYLPGEMTLIKAEAYARLNDLPNALIQLNIVVTKSPSSDPFGIGANLPPTSYTDQNDLLNKIYKNRCIELYMSGLKLIDERRFNRNVSERKRNYLPFPFVERNDNPNTPNDPPF
ncbi:RagB/SusD family nutrient uptake outer membrane protein [Hydrotalea sp.]|uniref:RagB/SusD family nutrient uptake outer membrane protein n=1 Tax=Hydrotalea sp. TaxID=2881279 RepID=UPI0025896967|nr:RagB/SusD family nutrient uptake outer membrane protein [Hydrotalea sp.]